MSVLDQSCVWHRHVLLCFLLQCNECNKCLNLRGKNVSKSWSQFLSSHAGQNHVALSGHCMALKSCNLFAYAHTSSPYDWIPRLLTLSSVPPTSQKSSVAQLAKHQNPAQAMLVHYSVSVHLACFGLRHFPFRHCHVYYLVLYLFHQQ